MAGWILSGLTAAAKIQPIEFQNQRAAPIRSLAFDQLMGNHNLSLDPWLGQCFHSGKYPYPLWSRYLTVTVGDIFLFV